MPPTRREQLELDELLSDIYLGIETLPDNRSSATSRIKNQQTSSSNNNFQSTTNRQYTSPSKLNTATTSGRSNFNTTSPSHFNSNQQQQQQHPHQQEPQSLASIVTSTTPRRVRIIEPSDKKSKQLQQVLVEPRNSTTSQSNKNKSKHLVESSTKSGGRGPVKYVNTYKLIYHQEKNPDDDEDYSGSYTEDNNNYNNSVANHQRENSYYNQYHHLVTNSKNYDSDDHSNVNRNNHNDDEDDDDDDLNGKTRVEYYHTSWLDRQLGRVRSRRRSSKELTERQIKEKAMIDELKRNLKNGAITLRQSFKGKGKKNDSNSKSFDSYDLDEYTAELLREYDNNDENNNTNNNHNHQRHHTIDNRGHRKGSSSPKGDKKYNKYSSVFGSGLATLPRNRQNQDHHNKHSDNKTTGAVVYPSFAKPLKSPKPYNSSSINKPTTVITKQQQPVYNKNRSNYPTAGSNPAQQDQQQQTTKNKMHDTTTMTTTNYYSQTLPNRRAQHQLLQSHYRGANQNGGFYNGQAAAHQNTATSPSPALNGRPSSQTSMHRPYNTIDLVHRTNNTGSRSPNQYQSHLQQHQQHNHQPGNTISSMPSATEVVRSALSRSGSATSVNQLNKTINLLPTSPSPFCPSPTTPTQQLRACSPTLSPSPISGAPYNQQQQHHYQQQKPYQRPVQQHQQQPLYANPHASLMQHREEQLRRQAGNGGSLREFNELDSLLTSLSLSGPRQTTTTTTNVTAGQSSKPVQPSFGYGYSPAPQAQPQQHQHQQYQPATPATGGIDGTQRLGGQRLIAPSQQDLYAKVQKQPFSPNNMNNEQAKASYLQQNYLTAGRDGFTIDVTNKKIDNENCLTETTMKQNLSEFEPPIELLPSMEDYQNISKLNPVKNHYWYKPHMSRDRAIELLKDKPQGTFIVRDSTSFQGAFGLAVKVSRLPKNVLQNASLRNPNDPSSELIRHFLIEPTPGGVRLKGYANEPIFGSLPALIYQHSLFELALPCKLVIPRADIEDKNFNQKQKQFYDEFIASKEIAKHMPYEITSPNGGYRKYPGDVYVHNEHRIIYE